MIKLDFSALRLFPKLFPQHPTSLSHAAAILRISSPPTNHEPTNQSAPFVSGGNNSSRASTNHSPPFAPGGNVSANHRTPPPPPFRCGFSPLFSCLPRPPALHLPSPTPAQASSLLGGSPPGGGGGLGLGGLGGGGLASPWNNFPLQVRAFFLFHSTEGVK